jgi:hypothetical protein
MKPASPAKTKPRRKPVAPDLLMPHERDEARDQTKAEPHPVIEQAKRDLDAGLVDTDLRETPGLDAGRRDRLLRRGG